MTTRLILTPADVEAILREKYPEATKIYFRAGPEYIGPQEILNGYALTSVEIELGESKSDAKRRRVGAGLPL